MSLKRTLLRFKLYSLFLCKNFYEKLKQSGICNVKNKTMFRRAFTTKTIAFCSSCKHLREDVCIKNPRGYDIVTGQPLYLLAKSARNDKNNCGKDAKHFEYYNYAFDKYEANGYAVESYLWK